jgi:hypothetical protein
VIFILFFRVFRVFRGSFLNEIRQPTNSLVSAGYSASDGSVFLVVMADATAIDDPIHSGALVAGADSGHFTNTAKDSVDVPRRWSCVFHPGARSSAIGL